MASTGRIGILTGLVAMALAACGGGGASGGAGRLGIPPAVCSTHQVVNDPGSALMEPGGDCIGCHAQRSLEGFVFAGTAMASLHDDTNCAGLAGAVVRIMDDDGQVVELTTNASGNFFLRTAPPSFAYPFTAQVTYNGQTAFMTTHRSATETDCVACHTPAGEAGAPGRITVP